MSSTERQMELSTSESELLVKQAICYLDHEIERCNKVAIKTIAVCTNLAMIDLTIDNSSQRQLNLTEFNTASFSLPVTSQLLKIVTWDDEGLLPIATTFIEPNDIVNSWSFRLFGKKQLTLILPNRDRLFFTIKYDQSSTAESKFLIKLIHQPDQSPSLSKNFSVNGIKAPDSAYQRLASVPLILITCLIAAIAVLSISWLINRDQSYKDNIVDLKRSPHVNPGNMRGNNPTNAPINKKSYIIQPLIKPSESTVGYFDFSAYANNDGTNQQSILSIPITTDEIKIKLLATNNSNLKNYFAVIKSAHDQEIIWRKEVYPQKITSANMEVIITIPRRIFTNSDYQLIWEGSTSLTEQIPIQSHYLTIVLNNSNGR